MKLTFFKGASLRDPAHLFNASLDGNVRRGIDIYEGDKIDESALKNLIRARASDPAVTNAAAVLPGFGDRQSELTILEV